VKTVFVFLVGAFGALLSLSEGRWIVGAETSQIKRDEAVLFYPTFGRQTADGSSWTLAIHGVIFEPEQNSVKRAVLLAAIRRGLDRQITSAEAEVLDRRARLFLVDHERGKTIWGRIGSRTYRIGESAANGHFSATVDLSAAEVEALKRIGHVRDDWLSFEAVTRKDDRRRFPGRVRLIGPDGLSLISDIDDTIKISQVRDRKALLANTLLRPFQPVPGMARVYRELAVGGAAFHYVSASPWQLYEPLAEFLAEEQFPAGTFHLKHFRLWDQSLWEFLGSQEEYKSRTIEELLAAFPRRRFVLVGDTGEQDPEVFGRIARQHPDQIAAILLRNVTEETADNPRMRGALEGIKPDLWRLFREPGELDDVVKELNRRYGTTK
jgi:Phosphatidate phosphatase APP1, catalytic domain